jgi:outer membrane protein OmpA-like peptidoglycan-associated protein
MISSKHLLTFLCSAFLVASNAQGAEFEPYLGFDLGYDYLHTDVGGESHKNGLDLGVKALGSWRHETWFLDAGLGYQYESLFGSGISVQTGSPFAELSGRWKLDPQWSLGPITQLHVGDDNSRSETEDNNSLMWNGGAQLVYELSTDGRPFRVAAEVLTSLTGLEDRNLYSFKVGVQIPLGREEKRIERLPVVVMPVGVTKEVLVREATEDLKISLNTGTIGFKINSAKLDHKSQTKIRKLGEFLVANKIDMKEIKIGGHTDSTGKKDYNQKLSEQRAQVVKEVLVKAGVKAPISTQGFGDTLPIDPAKTASAYEKNRRTEIEFIQVKDKAGLAKEINRIMEQ